MRCGGWKAGSNCLYDDALYMWDLSKKKCRQVATVHGDGKLCSIALSADGCRLAYANSSGEIRCFDLDSEDVREKRSVKRAGSPVTALAFSPDGARLWSSSQVFQRLGIKVSPVRELSGELFEKPISLEIQRQAKYEVRDMASLAREYRKICLFHLWDPEDEKPLYQRLVPLVPVFIEEMDDENVLKIGEREFENGIYKTVYTYVEAEYIFAKKEDAACPDANQAKGERSDE